MTLVLSPIEVAATRSGHVRTFVPLNGATVASLQIGTSYDISGGWVVSFRVSDDGVNAYDFPVVVTLSAAGVTSIKDVSGYAYVCVEVTTNGTTGSLFPTVKIGGDA